MSGSPRPFACALVLLAAAGVAGCESTRSKSAALEAQAAGAVREEGLRITQANASATVTEAVVVQDDTATAAVVTVRNRGGAQAAVPLLLDVRGADGTSTYRNDTPGLDDGLTSVLALPRDGELTWVNDQVPAGIDAGTVKAELGAAPRPTTGALAELGIVGPRIAGDAESGIEATGRVRNTTGVAQRAVPVYAVARRGGKVVAAGRAVVPVIQPGREAIFHAFLVGRPSGADLEVRAVATSPEPR